MKKSFCRILSLLLTLLCVLGGFSAAAAQSSYTDVSDQWFAEAVRFVTEQGLFLGVSDTRFAPEGAMSRAMTVTVLWRLAGKPAPESENPFTDVEEESYYAAPVRWAAEQGIVSGVSADRFAPGVRVTREQLVAILYRYAKHSGAETSASVSLASYPDGERCADYAKQPLQWAIASGVLRGEERQGVSFLLPRNTATRAEVATIFMRFYRGFVLGEPIEKPALPADAAVQTVSEKLFVDGKTIPGSFRVNGLRYLRLADLTAVQGGWVGADRNLRLDALGHSFYFGANSAYALMDGRWISLGAPCVRSGGSWYAPAAGLLQALGFHELEDAEGGNAFYTRYPTNDRIPAGKRVTILRYHAVSDDLWGYAGLFISPATLEQQLREMEKMGCTFLTFEELDRIDKYKKPVLLTFDDGYDDNYTELFPILKRHNAKATIFMITGHIGRNHYLTEAQIKEMSDSGLVSFQSHTASHRNVQELGEAELRTELGDSRLRLARLLGKQPFAFSYPEARTSDLAKRLVAEYYRFSVFRDNDTYETGTDPYAIPRYAMPRDISMQTFLSYFS